jgi:PqqD family protein of HPr-rel-A system
LSDAGDSTAGAAQIRWRAADPKTMDWASWDDEHVLFHLPSGKTHLMNAAAHRLLTEILTEPRDLEQITALLGDHPGAERDQQRSETFELLLRLEELGLVHLQ